MSDTVIIPEGKNFAHNPRPASTANMTTSAGSSVTFVTDRSYSGNGSAFLTLAPGEAFNWLAAADDDADLSAASGAGTWYLAYHASGLSGAGITALAQINYTDGTSTSGPAVAVDSGATDFRRNALAGVVVDPAKTIRNVRIRLTNSGGVSRTVYLGGLDIRKNQAIDGFIHGAGGDGYSWLGTVNNSPSVRSAYSIGPTIGTGGQIMPSVTLHVVNRQNQILKDITENFIDGSVNYDLDAEQWKGSCQLILNEPGLIYPLADEYVRITLRIEHPDGTVEEGPIGMFNMDAPTERWSDGHDSWTYEGRDMLSLLAQWTIPGVANPDQVGDLISNFVVQNNTAWATAIRNLLITGAEFFPVQYSFPGLSGTADGGLWWEDAVPVLTLLNDILIAAGWQRPWVTPAGVITSAPAGIDPATATPNLILSTGENSPIRWPFEVDPETSRVGNRVRVVSTREVYEQTGIEDPEPYILGYLEDQVTVPGTDDVYERKRTGPKRNNGKRKWEQVLVEEGTPPKIEDIPIWVDPAPYPVYGWVPYHVDVTQTNEDPSHPLSYPRLGRWIDLPLITLPQVSSVSVARNHAAQALMEASTVPMRVRLTTRVMLRGLNEIYELDMSDAYGDPIPSGQGRYWCRGWTLQLGSPWEMVHNLTRVVGFDVAAGRYT